MRSSAKAFLLSGLLASMCLFSGCDDGDDIDHDPPDGMGSVVVDNRSYDDIRVYVDGTEVRGVDDNEWRAYDLFPGEYRIFLEQDDGWREYGRDVDVLEGRLTVMEVSIDAFDTRYDVFVYLD